MQGLASYGSESPEPPSSYAVAQGSSSARLGKHRASSASPPPFAPVPSPSAEPSPAPATSTIQLDSLSEFGIPPLPTGPCNPAVVAKLDNFHHLAKTRGLHFNDSLSASKAFRNPRIYSKLVEFVNVVESETNWSKSIWDPQGLAKGSTAVEIATAQHNRSEARNNAQAAGVRSAISFSSSTSHSSSFGTNRGDDQARVRDAMTRKSVESGANGGEKRSRWDNGRRERSRSPRRR